MNIHVLPTDKPSRLQKNKFNNLFLSEEPKSYSDCTNQNIYITNDEEIKEGDWYWLEKIDRIGSESGAYKSSSVKVSKLNTLASNCKKIILTTDQDLIKEGVQAIDYEFLDWFVKNPSCEFVEFERKTIIEYEPIGHAGGVYKYKIIIPKEEPKQERLEEVAEGLFKFVENDDFKNYILNIQKETFIAGAKWQQQQNKNLYSEQTVTEYAYYFESCYAQRPMQKPLTPSEWFEQFKKK